MSGSRRDAWAAAVLATAGGLLMAGGSVADWVRRDAVRDVGGVAVPDPTSVAGTEVAGQLVGLGVATLLLGLILLAVRGMLRRAAGALLALAGLGGLALVAVGTRRAAGLPGTLAAGPAIAALGAVAVLMGAVLTLRAAGPRPTLPPRYALDERDEVAGDWERASVEADDA